MIDRLNAIEKRYNDISVELSSPEVIQDIKKMTELSKEQTRLSEVVEIYSKLLVILVKIKNWLKIVN